MVHSKNTYYQLADEELQVIHAHITTAAAQTACAC
jgi:hypothetical protein